MKDTYYNTSIKNEKFRSRKLSPLNNKTATEQTNRFVNRLHKLEEENAQLEKLMEQSANKLTQSAETNAKFVSIVAHDLRGPFCTIMAALSLLKEKLAPHKIADTEDYFNFSLNSANRALALLDSLLKWTRLQNEGNSFNPFHFNLHELIEEEIADYFISARLKQITLIHSIPSGLKVNADLQMVKTILRNLMENAIKYTNTGGEVILSAIENSEFVEITVKDNGVGISFAAQQELFKIDSFHSTTGTLNEKGPGLGLLFCKEFVELHGGRIWFISERGVGSEFKFTLPNYPPK